MDAPESVVKVMELPEIAFIVPTARVTELAEGGSVCEVS
jgi:hypothetical protein